MTDCNCRACWSERNEGQKAASLQVGPEAFVLMNPIGMPFIVCALCGNKRCPHASDHREACTGSNEPGQPGSIYG